MASKNGKRVEEPCPGGKESAAAEGSRAKHTASGPLGSAAELVQVNVDLIHDILHDQVTADASDRVVNHTMAACRAAEGHQNLDTLMGEARRIAKQGTAPPEVHHAIGVLDRFVAGESCDPPASHARRLRIAELEAELSRLRGEDPAVC